MIIFWQILTIIVVYLLIVFVGFRLVAPFMQFGKWNYSSMLPGNMKEVLGKIISSSKTADEYLHNAFLEVTSHFFVTRGNSVLKLNRLFRSNLENIWHSAGYAHCTTQNYILACFLVNGGFLSPKILRFEWCF